MKNTSVVYYVSKKEIKLSNEQKYGWLQQIRTFTMLIKCSLWYRHGQKFIIVHLHIYIFIYSFICIYSMNIFAKYVKLKKQMLALK